MTTCKHHDLHVTCILLASHTRQSNAKESKKTRKGKTNLVEISKKATVVISIMHKTSFTDYKLSI